MRLTDFLALLCAAAVLALPLSGAAEALPKAHAAPRQSAARQSAAHRQPLSEKERATHALERFTFGARPGQLECIEEMGVGKWLDEQLHPETIDDSALESRLSQLPAMHLGSADLLKKYPPPPVIREVEKGGLALPTDPVEHAIYADAVARFRAQQGIKQAGQQRANATVDALLNAPAMPNVDDPKDVRATKNKDIKASNDLLQAGKTADGAAKDSHAGAEEGVRLLAMPPALRWSAVLNAEPGVLRPMLKNMKQPERMALVAGFTPVQKEALTAMVDVNRVVAGELMEEKVLRAIYSDRQLNEVMTDFWLNHFNIYLRKNGEMPWLLATYEREVIRPLALGSFERLLRAVAHSPAMLVYLDNQQSIGPASIAASRRAGTKGGANQPGLNENYARELMELHTLGVNGGYSQKDVTEVARVFTGWGVESPADGSAFRFANRRHEAGTKTVLGRTIFEGGENEGIEVLHMLAENPATARFLSTKLATRFVSDNPPSAMIDTMARTYEKTHGDIREVLRAMVKSPDFWSADAFRAKVKTPLEFVASAARATNADVENAGSLVQALDRLGMPLYGVQQPNGYSLKAAPWLGSQGLLNRFNFALALTSNKLPGVEVTLPPAAGSDQDQETMLEEQLLNGPAAPETHTAVMLQRDNPQLPVSSVNPIATPNRGAGSRPRTDLFTPASATKALSGDDKSALTAALLLGSPQFQRH